MKARIPRDVVIDLLFDDGVPPRSSEEHAESGVSIGRRGLRQPLKVRHDVRH
jgi:hypothetical protein